MMPRRVVRTGLLLLVLTTALLVIFHETLGWESARWVRAAMLAGGVAVLVLALLSAPSRWLWRMLAWSGVVAMGSVMLTVPVPIGVLLVGAAGLLVAARVAVMSRAWPPSARRLLWRAVGMSMVAVVALSAVIPRIHWSPRPGSEDLSTLMDPTAGEWAGFTHPVPLASVAWRLHPGATASLRDATTAVSSMSLAWRVADLQAFNGRAWSPMTPPPPPPPPKPCPACPPPKPMPQPTWMMAKWVALVPTGTPAAPDVPGLPMPPLPLFENTGATLSFGMPWPPRVSGVVAGWGFGGLSPQQRQRDLALPAGAAPRTRAWAAALRRANPHDNAAILAAILAHWARGNYRYSLDPPRPPGDPTDGFVWVTRVGYCQHYASATAVMLRAAGIPAMVVVGYAVPHPVRRGNGLWTSVLGTQDAHAWVEADLGGTTGWVRVDPTALAKPMPPSFWNRIESKVWNHLPGWVRNNPWVSGAWFRTPPKTSVKPPLPPRRTHHHHEAWVPWGALGLLFLTGGMAAWVRRRTPLRVWNRWARRWPEASPATPERILAAASARGEADAALVTLVQAWDRHRHADAPLPKGWRRGLRRWRPPDGPPLS